jgi:HD-like signal output (HDOD) protein
VISAQKTQTGASTISTSPASHRLGQPQAAATPSSASTVLRRLISLPATPDAMELAALIHREPALQTRLLCAANTLAFNPWAVPVSAVADAIDVMGPRTARELAIALLLHEISESSWLPSERQRAASVALAAGLLSRSLSEEIHPECADRTLICSLLTAYGRLLMRSIMETDGNFADMLGSDAPFADLFGQSPAMVSRTLLRTRNLPKAFGEVLKSVSREQIDEAACTPDPTVRNLAEIGIGMSVALETSAAATAGELRAELLQTIASLLPAGSSIPDLAPILKRAELRWQTLNRASGISTSNPGIAHKLAAAANLPDAASAEQPRMIDLPPQPAPKSEIHLDSHALNGCLAAMASLLAQRCASMTAICTEFARGVHDSLGGEETLVLLRDNQGAQMRVRSGFGSLHIDLHGQPLVEPGSRNIFSVCLSRGEDVVMDDVSAPLIQPFVPRWLRRGGLRRFLVILPLIDEREVFGLVLTLGHEQQPLHLTQQIRSALRSLRNHVAVARRGLEQRSLA